MRVPGIESPQCNCNRGTVQTISHLLIACPELQRQRQRLIALTGTACIKEWTTTHAERLSRWAIKNLTVLQQFQWTRDNYQAVFQEELETQEDRVDQEDQEDQEV
jgi:hypothetical protein